MAGMRCKHGQDFTNHKEVGDELAAAIKYNWRDNDPVVAPPDLGADCVSGACRTSKEG